MTVKIFCHRIQYSTSTVKHSDNCECLWFTSHIVRGYSYSNSWKLLCRFVNKPQTEQIPQSFLKVAEVAEVSCTFTQKSLMMRFKVCSISPMFYSNAIQKVLIFIKSFLSVTIVIKTLHDRTLSLDRLEMLKKFLFENYTKKALISSSVA